MRASHGRGLVSEATDTGGDRRFVSACSRVVVALMVVESALGLLVHDLYHEATWAVAALRGNDFVTLALVAPLLGIAIRRSRHSDRWLPVWLGGLLYGVYNFAYYAFGTTFNDVFLVHVAALALSIAALIALCMRLDIDTLANRLEPHGADRLIAAYMPSSAARYSAPGVGSRFGSPSPANSPMT